MRIYQKPTFIAIAMVMIVSLTIVITLTVFMKNHEGKQEESVSETTADTTVVDSSAKTDIEIPTISEHEIQPKEVGGLDIDVGQMHRNPEPEVVGGTVEYGEKEIDNE